MVPGRDGVGRSASAAQRRRKEQHQAPHFLLTLRRFFKLSFSVLLQILLQSTMYLDVLHVHVVLVCIAKNLFHELLWT